MKNKLFLTLILIASTSTMQIWTSDNTNPECRWYGWAGPFTEEAIEQYKNTTPKLLQGFTDDTSKQKIKKLKDTQVSENVANWIKENMPSNNESTQSVDSIKYLQGLFTTIVAKLQTPTDKDKTSNNQEQQ